MEEVKRSVPEIVLDDIYIAMTDAYNGPAENQANLRRCLNYLEKEQGYRPPALCGYMDELNEE